jgi:hypothetical protein
LTRTKVTQLIGIKENIKTSFSILDFSVLLKIIKVKIDEAKSPIMYKPIAMGARKLKTACPLYGFTRKAIA